MRDLQKEFSNCINMMDKLNIDYGNIVEVKVNTRAKRRWGQCGHNIVGRESTGKPIYVYKINISSLLLDEKVPVEALYDTIIHEILHTCPGCFNHGYEWKKRADVVNKELGYDIKRCSSAEEKGIDDSIIKDYHKPKYIVRCKKCGREVGKARKCSMVDHPEFWVCGKCGGTFERIKQLQIKYLFKEKGELL